MLEGKSSHVAAGPEAVADTDERSLVKTVQRTKLLGEELVESGLIGASHLAMALDEQRLTGEQLGSILVRLRLLRADELNAVLAKRLGIARWDPHKAPADPHLVSLAPFVVWERCLALPITRLGRTLTIATANVFDPASWADVERSTGCHVRVLYTAESDVSRRLTEMIGRADGAGEVHVPTLVAPPESMVEPEGAATDTVDALLRHAIATGVTDVHIEPEEKILRIRERLDGMLVHRMALPKTLHPAVVARIKILAGLDITESRLPQDGKIRFGASGSPGTSIRVSSFLTHHGEKVVCRILDHERFVMDLERLGLDGQNLDLVRAAISAPYGMILISGPTGAGKTSTLYSLLSGLDAAQKNIMTIEDPIEIELPLVRQSQINVKAGLTFESALRAILRQDPDVILIGEMRDRETAEIAVRAALTGHLVFSTIHTNSAAGVASRLKDLGVEPYLVASSLLLAVAQRLVRKICPACKEEQRPDSRLLMYVEQMSLRTAVEGQETGTMAPTYYHGAGCGACRGTGYRGRIGVFEVLPVDSRVRERILAGADAAELERDARAIGFTTLWDDAVTKVRNGVTTLEEAVRVTRAEVFADKNRAEQHV
jgi:type IV pilus assembly protein PilB